MEKYQDPLQQELGWYLPDLGGGEDKGLNDAGIENFSRRMHLAREVCQNVIDAQDLDQGPVPSVEFELLQITREDFPGWQRFSQIFNACKVREVDNQGNTSVRERTPPSSVMRFFDKGTKLMASDSIPVLRIRDRYTCGLDGDETDRAGRWYRLVRGQGRANFEGSGGGTYGIGQRAPFAFSDLRLLFYSSMLPDQSKRFMGKSVLCTCRDPETARLTQNVAFYGAITNDEQAVRCIQDEDQIPPRFRRSAPGTDIYIVGFDVPDWHKQIVRSVLTNFYSAIEHGRLSVVVSNGSIVTIDRDSLVKLLNREIAGAKGDEKRNLEQAKYSVLALRNPFGGKPFVKTIANIDEAKLYIYRTEKRVDKIAHIRKPGMVVFSKGSNKLSNYQAVLLIDNDKGNRFLSDLEDPGHTRWHEEEAKSWTETERADARQTLSDLRKFYRDCLTKLRGETTRETEDLPELAKILPAEEDGDEDISAFDGTYTGDQTNDETALERIAPTKQSKRKKTRLDLNTPLAEKSTEGGGADLGNTGAGGSDGTTDGGRGGEGSNAGPGSGSTGGNEGDNYTITESDLAFRSWATANASGKMYVLALTPHLPCAGSIVLKGAGETGRYRVRVTKAWTLADGNLLRVNNGRILGLDLPGSICTRIAVELDSDIDITIALGR